MALVQFGAGVLDMRGSIGGTVYSKNRSGNYVRARTTPVNPNTARQQVMKTLTANNAQHWSGTLTIAQRAAWEVYAQAIVFTNKLGEQIKLTGFNHFMRSNATRRQVGIPRVLDAPIILNLPGEDSAFAGVIDEATQQIAVTFDDTLPWVDQDDAGLAVYMSMPQGAGTTFIKGPWRLAGVILGDSVTAPTTPQNIAVPFPVGVGQVIAVRARITEEDGRLSGLFQQQSIVAA